MSRAAKSGQPAMNNIPYPIPVSVPRTNTAEPAANGAGGAASNDVSASVVSDSSKLDQGTDARQAGAGTTTGNTATPGNVATQNAAAQNAAPPTNHDAEMKKAREKAEKKARKRKKKEEPQQAAPAAPASGDSAPANGSSSLPQKQ